MAESVTIALDAMGGDNAPHIVIAGANIARRRYPNVRYLLFGDREEIEPRVAKQRGLAEFVEIHHTPEQVAADDKPSQVLRSGRSTSMWLAIDSVKHGNSSGIVSAGNTGAMMAMAMFQWRNLPGIDRPAIASFF
ncbi:MAG: phosphate acyltransferase, partial [Alphaproteobacteria bacterium]|nr:phosphate acyltransferase [Alphaproteobacteria bacterium]